MDDPITVWYCADNKEIVRFTDSKDCNVTWMSHDAVIVLTKTIHDGKYTLCCNINLTKKLHNQVDLATNSFQCKLGKH